MGFEIMRFLNNNDVNQDLICIICKGVLEDPVWAQQCEHAFCKVCIHKWLSRRTTCPNDRQNLQQSHLKPIPRFMRNILDKLEIRCDFSSLGCEQVVRLEALRQHVNACDFNPEKQIECQNGCGLIIKKAEINDHNCVKELRKTVNHLVEENLKCDRLMGSVKYDINLLRIENNRLNELTNNLQNDIKHIKQLVGLKGALVSDTSSVSCITGTQTPNTSLTSSSVKICERNSRLVPNPYVLITPLQSSCSLRSESVLSSSDEPSSSTIATPSVSRLNNEEPAFKRRAGPMPALRQIPSLVQHRPYSPPSPYSSPNGSPRFVPNMPTLSPHNESISEDEEHEPQIAISDYSNYNYVTLEAEQEFDENESNEHWTSAVDQAQDNEDFEVNTNDENI